MISRSWEAATPEEHGHDDPYIEADSQNPHDGNTEMGRADHDPVLDMIERDGVSYQVERCSKCGIIAPHTDSACRGMNHTLDEFTNHTDRSGMPPLPTPRSA